MPFFVVFGALSDRIGRKRIMMAGCLLAAISYVPIYHAMQAAAGSNVVTGDVAAEPGHRRDRADAADAGGGGTAARAGRAAVSEASAIS